MQYRRPIGYHVKFTGGAYLSLFLIAVLLLMTMLWPRQNGVRMVAAAPNQQSTCNGQSILFIGAASTPTSDEQIIAALKSQGYEVQAISIDNYTTDQGEAAALVMLSRSLAAGSIGNTFTALSTAVMTWEGALYDDLLMTGPTQGTDFGSLSARTTVEIADPSHPLAAGLTGTVTTHSSNSTFWWGSPSASAITVATVESSGSTSGTQAAIFAYESGSLMSGVSAPARRVGFHDANYNRLSAEGKQLFNAAVKWAINCTPTQPPTDYTLTIEIDGQGSVDYDPEDTFYQDGDLVVLSAVAEPGWAFDGWNGTTITEQNPTFVIFENTDIVVNASFVVSATATPPPTATPIVTPTATATLTPTAIITPTFTPTFTPVLTPTATATLTPTLVPTLTPTPILTPTLVLTPTAISSPTPIGGGTPTPGTGSGSILREWWLGIEDGYSVEALTSLTTYPDEPDGRDEITEFKQPFGFGSNYGMRLRGYIHPPTTGAYIFYIAADDRATLLLSSDEDPANAIEVAQAPGWTSEDDWDKYPEQQSVAFVLEEGERYYIESLHVNGGGGDNMSVAWEGPGFARTLVDGDYLSPFEVEPPSTPEATPTVDATETPAASAEPTETVVPETPITETPLPITPAATPTPPPSTPLPTTPVATPTSQPSPSPVVAPAQLSAQLDDSLLVDNDNDGMADLGDTLRYQLTLLNSGAITAESVVFQLVPDELSRLIVGSVVTTQGEVVKGNQSQDDQVVVSLGNLAAGVDSKITFDVQIIDASAAPVFSEDSPQVQAQGTVIGLNLDDISSDDPESPEPSDPTFTELALSADLDVSKTDLLLVDSDDDGRISPADMLIYIIRIQNNGQLAAKGVRIIDELDLDTTLVSGSVIASKGVVIQGNNAVDSSIEVLVESIPANSDVFVRLQAKINENVTDGQLINQATVTLASGNGVTGQNRIQSNDPDTAVFGDPTKTEVFSRSNIFEPQVYLPLLTQ